MQQLQQIHYFDAIKTKGKLYHIFVLNKATGEKTSYIVNSDELYDWFVNLPIIDYDRYETHLDKNDLDENSEVRYEYFERYEYEITLFHV